MPSATRFAVAIPTFNRRDTVMLAVQSVLRQRRPAHEIFVLCDGCTDGTQEALAALDDRRVHVIDLPKGEGYAYAHRNYPVAHSSSDAVVWMGDDDLIAPDYLERAGAIWDGGQVDLVVSAAVLVHDDDALEWVGRDLREPAHRAWFSEVGNTAIMGAVLVRRTLVEQVGGWDGAVARAGDYELWQRIVGAGARLGWQPHATLLHFRATGREQPWEERVVQNRRWLAALEDPDGRSSLATQAEVARSAWEGRLSAEVRERTRIEAALRDEVRVLREAEAQAQAQLAEAAPRLAQAMRDRATLEAIYGGGWWRLRERVLRSTAWRGPRKTP